jgi:hypothetical protein
MTTAARVMDRTGAQPRLEVEVRWFPAFELVMQLAALGATDLHSTFDVLPPAFDVLRTKLSEGLVGALARLGPSGGRNWGGLIGLACQEGLRSPEDLTARVEAMTAIELRLVLFGAHWPALRTVTPPLLMLRAAEGDRDAALQLVAKVRTISLDDSDSDAIEALLDLSPEDTKAAVVAALRGWHREVFAAQEAALTETLAADLEAKVALARTLTP